MTMTRQHQYHTGFTLVEMAVIAPIVVLLIGVFVALIVSLTGNVMSTRGLNMMTYNTQSALNRIEDDVRLSTTFLAVNNISLTSTGQGYGDTTTAGSTTNFTNIQDSSSPSIILNTLVTDNNPLYGTANVIYLSNQPNNCSSATEYAKNTPMTANIVYYVKDTTLWRRVLMPANYATTSVYCGSKAPWQVPTCTAGYSAASRPFCVTNDEAVLSDVSSGGVSFQYYASANSTAANSTAINTGASADTRNAALQSCSTIEVTLSTSKIVAGNSISHSATLRATRLDANASSIAK